ncbi:MAG: hypothetical protein ACPGVH_03880 [Chitinophagales bacterium]
MTKNLYYEYREWSIFWGLMLDQKKEVQKVLDNYNNGGWKVVQFQWNDTKVDVFKKIFILIITILSLGFFQYWTGFSIVFEQSNTFSNHQQKIANNDFQEQINTQGFQTPAQNTISKDDLFK